MDCPQCAWSLQEITYENVPVHTCPNCGGEFVAGDALAAIVQIREQTFPADLQETLAAAEPFAGVPESRKQRALNCPACDNPMSVINYCGDSGVFVDRCTACNGLWLDQDELEQIQVLMERWTDEAPAKLRQCADQLEQARQSAARASSARFQGSRFAFINALINRFLDAA